MEKEAIGKGGAAPKWPAAERRQWPVKKLVPYARNARLHSRAQIKLLVEAIQHYGWTTPLLIDENGTLIAGHGRVLAAQQMGLKDVPVMVARGWNEAQKKAYRLWDNQSVILGDWDMPLLSGELKELQQLDFNMELTGFSGSELDRLLRLGIEDSAAEIAPEPPKDPISRRGDLWRLGEHRLYCGDCTQKSDVRAALGNYRPHLMVTDPPYGVNYNPNWRNEANRWAGSKVKLGAAATGKVCNDNIADWKSAWRNFNGDIAYIWHAALMTSIVETSLVAVNLIPRYIVIWNKTHGVIGRGDYHWQHEPCFYVVRKGCRGHWQGSRSETTVWDIPKLQTSETGHGTQKPIACMRKPIENNSKIGDSIYDPFVGSGTTIIAAEMMRRHCIALDIDPTYVDVAALRWQDYTGKQAILDATGQTYEQVKAERDLALRPVVKSRRLSKARMAADRLAAVS